MKKLVPKRRFEKFKDSEAWEQRKLGEVVDFLDERRRPLESGLRKAGPYPYYGASGIIDYVNDYIFDEELILLSEDGANIIDRNYRVCFMARGKYWVNNHAHVLKSKENYCNGFICESLERLDYVQYNTGTAQPKLNQEVCRNINILVPKLEEQKLISAYLENLDNLITLHQRKLKKLKILKSAYLSEMFPKDGELYPKRRFAGFTDPWEQRKLRELIISAYQGINTTADNVEYSEDGVPILQAKHITSGEISFQETRYLNKERYSDYFLKYMPHKEDLLFANIGTIGPSTVVNTEKKFLIAWNILKLEMNEMSDSYFIHLIFDQMKDSGLFSSLQRGNATKFINKDAMLNISMLIPSKHEQSQIGVFFKSLDHLITLHQRKLEKLEALKQAYLSEMFI